jgi:hypothetical protein
MAFISCQHGPTDPAAASRRQQNRVLLIMRVDGVHKSILVVNDFDSADNSWIIQVDKLKKVTALK